MKHPTASASQQRAEANNTGAVRVAIRRPTIYFAGKISKRSNWRTEIVGHCDDVYGCCPDDLEDPEQFFDPAHTVDCGSFEYGGPFYVACDHGCFHGQNSHGIKNYAIDIHVGGAAAFERRGLTREELHRAVFDVNFGRVRRADYIFAWIDELDCFGTLVEIGHAQALGKRIVIGVGPNVAPDQLWMTCERAAVFRGSPGEVWEKFRRTILVDWVVVDMQVARGVRS